MRRAPTTALIVSRYALLGFALGAVGTAALCAGENTHRPAPCLAGLEEVHIVVEDLAPDGAQRTGLRREEIESAVGAALLRSGTVTVKDHLASSFVYVSVNLLPLREVRSTIFVVKLCLYRPTMVLREDGTQLGVTSAVTWSSEWFGLGKDANVRETIKRGIRDSIDAFTVAYFRENPQAAPHSE